MTDCTNTGVRDLLPNYSAGRLEAGDRDRVGRHLESCADCTAELEIVRVARRALAASPEVDVARIVAALPRSPRSASPRVIPIGSRRRAVSSARSAWAAPRRIAAIAAVAVGAVGLAVAGARGPARQVVASAPAGALSAGALSSGAANSAVPVANSSELSLASGVSDLSDESLRALLGDIDSIDDTPLADPGEALPAVSGIEEDTGV